MIQLLGEITLIMAWIAASIQSTLPLLGTYSRNPYLIATARPSALAQAACVCFAYLLLTIAFVTNDFSIAYVAENSHPALPFMYRLTAAWGAHEGSILLWIVFLSAWTMVYAYAGNACRRPMVIALLGLLSAFFLSFLLLTSNPFLPAPPFLQGHDLNPLLQDPGFVIHPPMLYAGYVGFAVAFAITQAALLSGQLDQAWARSTRRFATAAWCFLTLGIALGSWWAYRVLGWGGFWFWDPVENASLLPWLAGTALIHVLVLVEKRDVAKNWAALLAMVCFLLSLLGTFLVRSGVLVSAHTFATDPKRGVFLLGVLAIVMTASLVNYFMRLSPTPRQVFPFTRVSRETSLLINSALLTTAMLTVLLGTLYPLILDALHLGMISVGAPYFNSVMMPIVLVIMTAMAAAAYSQWGEQSLSTLFKLAWKQGLISFASAAGLLWWFAPMTNLSIFLCLGLSFWIVLSVRHYFRWLPAMSLAHFGFAICVMGIMLSSLLHQEKEVRLQPGGTVALGPYQFFFLSTTGVSEGNYRGIRAHFEVIKNTHHVTDLYPEKRIYTVRDMIMTKVAIHPGIFRDLYIALGEPLDQDNWSVRIYYKPFMRWIWFGGMIMIIGGIFAILRRQNVKNSN